MQRDVRDLVAGSGIRFDDCRSHELRGYHDEYRERVLKLIRDKAKGKEIVLPEAEETPKVADIIEALSKSIEGRRRALGQAEGDRAARPR